jgi:aspartyl-tRNA synthetase
VFVDLRDHTGVTQLVINPERAPAAAEVAKEIRNEFVLRARGDVVARAPETVNAAMPTGEVELQVDELEIVSRSTPLPFQLDEEGVDERCGCATAGSTSARRACSGTFGCRTA